jgi:hypothetical protein
LDAIRTALARNPVTVLTGPRQAGQVTENLRGREIYA